MNATEIKLVSYLEQKNNYPSMVQNEMELLTHDFLIEMETSIELYASKCKPIIEDIKLVSYLEQKNNYPSMVQNEMELLANDFLTKLETSMEVYATKCKPIIEDKLRIPVLVQQKSDQLIGGDDDGDDENRTVLTPTVYAKKIQNITESFLKEESNIDYYLLDSDGRGDTEEEVGNLLRLYPEGLNFKAGWLQILRCQNVKSLLFVPIILKLRKDLRSGRDPLRYDDADDDADDDAADVQIVIDSIFPRLLPDESRSITELYDERCIIVLQRMHNMGLITTRDFLRMKNEGKGFSPIFLMLMKNNQKMKAAAEQKNGITRRFREIFECQNYFSKHRFRFLVKFYPEQMITLHDFSFPGLSVFLYFAAKYPTIDAFRCVFATGLSLYPIKRGINLLHQMNAIGESPHMLMCENHGKKATGAVIRETLQSYNATPYDPVNAFVYATTENTIRLDGVYSLLRTHPDILQLSLRSDTTTTTATATTSGTEGSTKASFPLPDSKRKYRKRKR